MNDHDDPVFRDHLAMQLSALDTLRVAAERGERTAATAIQIGATLVAAGFHLYRGPAGVAAGVGIDAHEYGVLVGWATPSQDMAITTIMNRAISDVLVLAGWDVQPYGRALTITGRSEFSALNDTDL